MQTTGLKGFNLSFQQARLWSLQGKSQAYHALCAIRVEGVFKREIFQQALQWVVEQHSILRTSFSCLPGMDVPVQVIHDQVEPGYAMIDLENLQASTQEWQLQ